MELCEREGKHLVEAARGPLLGQQRHNAGRFWPAGQELVKLAGLERAQHPGRDPDRVADDRAEHNCRG